MKLSFSRCRWGNVLNTNYADLSGLRSMAEEIGRKSDGAPPSSVDVPAVSENCQGDAACQKLLAESAGSIYKVRADHATGTGWVGPDGRLVTNYHVIMGKREITAEDNQGRVYRLGKDVAIDDVNDLAALGFVDGPPKGTKPLQIDTAPPKVGDQATLLSHRFGHSLELSQGTFSQQYTMADRVGTGDHRRHLEEQRAKWRTEDNPLNRDKDAYMSRTIYDFKIGGNHGSSGAPIFDKTGRVVSVVELQGLQDKHAWSIPVSSVSALLNESSSQGKFRVTAGYETGVSNFFNRVAGESKLHAVIDTAVPAAGILSLSKVALGSSGKLALGTGFAFLAGSTYSDGKALYNSTNWRDVLANGVATAGDAALSAGLTVRFAPQARSLSLPLLGVGAALKAGAELVPNHFTIQGIKRANNDPRPPFLDAFFRPM